MERPGKILLFDITHRLAHRVLLTRLVELDGNICLYLTMLLITTLAWVGEALVISEGT